MDEYCNKCNKQVKFDIDEHIVYRCPECHKEQEDDTSVNIPKLSDAVIHIHKNDNPDSLEVGTPSKGGVIKIYGDYNDVATFNKKIDNAIAVRKYATERLNDGN